MHKAWLHDNYFSTPYAVPYSNDEPLPPKGSILGRVLATQLLCRMDICYVVPHYERVSQYLSDHRLTWYVIILYAMSVRFFVTQWFAVRGVNTISKEYILQGDACEEHPSKTQLVNSGFESRKLIGCWENRMRKYSRALQSGDWKKTEINKFDS